MDSEQIERRMREDGVSDLFPTSYVDPSINYNVPVEVRKRVYIGIRDELYQRYAAAYAGYQMEMAVEDKDAATNHYESMGKLAKGLRVIDKLIAGC